MHSQSSAQFITATVSSSHLTKKVELARGAVKQARAALGRKEQELAEGALQMEELQGSWRTYEAKARGTGVSRERHVQLDEDQVCGGRYRSPDARRCSRSLPSTHTF